MRGFMLRSLCGLMLCVFFVAGSVQSVLAQSTVTGGIAGTVTDQSKAVVAGAQITVRSIETNAQVTATTDNLGNFRVGLLKPGLYAVAAQAANFAPAKAERVVVEVGRVTEIELTLPVAGAKEIVEVAAEAPVVNALQQDFTTNLNQTSVSDLPINGRRWSQFALLTPGTTMDGTYGLISFRGISGLMNNSTVDGGDDNQAFFSEERGRTRSQYVISQESVQEFQVNTSDYSAEYGRAAGAVVNTVTKSGGNRFHGEGFYFIRDNTLGAINDFTTELVGSPAGCTLTGSTACSSYTPQKFKPIDRRQEFGGNFGGPIVKDKWFFFFNYDGQRQNIPGVSIPSSPTAFFSPSGATLAMLTSLCNGVTAGSSPCNTTGAPYTTSNIPAAQQAIAQGYYNNSLGFLSSIMGTQPRNNNQDIEFLKMDWRLDQNNTFTASFNRMRRFGLADVQTPATVSRAVDDWGNDAVKVDVLNLRLTSLLTNRLSNELRFSYGRDFEFETQPFVNPAEAALLNAATTHGVYGNLLPDTYISYSGGAFDFGLPYYLQRPAFPDERKEQVADTATWSHGRHTIKWGLDIMRAYDLMNNLYEGQGEFYYCGSTALTSWIIDYTNALNGSGGSKNYCDLYQDLGSPTVRFATLDYGAFLQDDIRVTRRLMLNFGLRWEKESLPRQQLPNSLLPLTTTFPPDNNNFGPRFGFAWDIFGDAKTVLRGGYGIYYGRIINSTISSAITSSGLMSGTTPLGQASYTITPSTSGAPAYPNVITSAAGQKQNVAWFAPNIQDPQIHQADLVLEREIARNTVLSISYLMSLGREMINYYDTNLNLGGVLPTTYSFYGGPLNGQSLVVPVYVSSCPSAGCGTVGGVTAVNNPNYGHMTEILSNVNSNYNAMVVQFNRRMTKGLQFQWNYTWSHALDNGQNSTTFDSNNAIYDPAQPGLEYGNSAFDIRHRIVGSMVWQPEYFKERGRFTKALLNGWSLAPILTFSSGFPLSEATSGNPTLPSGYRYDWSGFNGSGGSNRLAPLYQRNSWRGPWGENIDLRIARGFHITERHKVELMAEAFNLFNHPNFTSLNGTMYSFCSSSSTPSCPSSTIPVNTLIYNTTGPFLVPTTESSTLFRERQIQFGARYSF